MLGYIIAHGPSAPYLFLQPRVSLFIVQVFYCISNLIQCKSFYQYIVLIFHSSLVFFVHHHQTLIVSNKQKTNPQILKQHTKNQTDYKTQGCVWYVVQRGTGQDGTRVSHVWHVLKWNQLQQTSTSKGHGCSRLTPWNSLVQDISD